MLVLDTLDIVTLHDIKKWLFIPRINLPTNPRNTHAFVEIDTMAEDARTKKKRDEQHMRAIQEMLALPANQNCADCNARGPKWAAVNIGCFLCIRCGGLHRKMGTHISKIKSTTLDTWSPEHIEFMQSMGNAKVNEAYLSRGNAPRININDDIEMEAYIRNKYEKRYFSNDGPAPPSRHTPQGQNDNLVRPGSSRQAAAYSSPSSTYPARAVANTEVSHKPSQAQISQFRQMGFDNEGHIQNALLIAEGNVDHALNLLLEWNQNSQPEKPQQHSSQAPLSHSQTQKQQQQNRAQNERKQQQDQQHRQAQSGAAQAQQASLQSNAFFAEQQQPLQTQPQQQKKHQPIQPSPADDLLGLFDPQPQTQQIMPQSFQLFQPTQQPQQLFQTAQQQQQPLFQQQQQQQQPLFQQQQQQQPFFQQHQQQQQPEKAPAKDSIMALFNAQPQQPAFGIQQPAYGSASTNPFAMQQPVPQQIQQQQYATNNAGFGSNNPFNALNNSMPRTVALMPAPYASPMGMQSNGMMGMQPSMHMQPQMTPQQPPHDMTGDLFRPQSQQTQQFQQRQQQQHSSKPELFADLAFKF